MLKLNFIKNEQSGFTIVELLLVIVVIGILSGLILNTAQTAQKEANNAVQVRVASQYKTALKAYLTENGQYPNAGGSSYTCLGDKYTDNDSSGLEDCAWSNSARADISPTLNSSLKTYMGQELPTPNLKKIEAFPGLTFQGLGYWNTSGITVDGRTPGAMIEYWLEGPNRNCRSDTLLDENYPTFATITSGISSGQWSGNTRCLVALPFASDL
jgi:prepilin-type N-terminal cleavage/methylation domain-containing protein